MADFTKRSTQSEMMDDFALGSDVIYPIMDELEVINKLLGGYNVFFDAFKILDLKDGMSISDWGCGGGDSLRILAKWARKVDLELEFVGVDATDSALAYAETKARRFPEISFINADVLSSALKSQQFDVVISSLFTHHFPDKSWIELIQKMLSCARKAVIINDLHRHWLAYHSIGVLTKLFSKSVMVKHDSQVSVLRGFTKAELEKLLKEAGIENFNIKWMWAFRWQVVIFKDQR